MYPRYTDSVLKPIFLCRVVLVKCASRVVLRSEEMHAAYTHVRLELQSFYALRRLGVQIEVADMYDGMSCVVCRNCSASRGEIVHFDFEGYSEVLLIDECETAFFQLTELFHLNGPLCSLIPALCFECIIHGLDRFEQDGIARMIEEVSSDDMVCYIVARGHRVYNYSTRNDGTSELSSWNSSITRSNSVTTISIPTRASTSLSLRSRTSDRLGVRMCVGRCK